MSVPRVFGRPRLPGAQERLQRLLEQRSAEPFEWGRHDCCLFAADAVQAQLGIDPAEGLRGRYGTALQAVRALRELGGLEALARQALGAPLRAPLLACSGDVGLVEDEGGDLLAVCIGEWWTAPTSRGLGLIALNRARISWRVGCA